VEEIDVSELEALRSQLNAKWGEQRAHLTLLPFLIRAIVLALREFPQVNARFDDETACSPSTMRCMWSRDTDG